MRVKPKKCRNPECDNTFLPYKSTDKFCSLACFRRCSRSKSIKKVSDKRKIQNETYGQLRRIFLNKPENRICPITGRPTTDVHHKKGRGKYFLDTSTWVALSREGHRKVEENPQWAYENGYSIKRLGK